VFLVVVIFSVSISFLAAFALMSFFAVDFSSSSLSTKLNLALLAINESSPKEFRRSRLLCAEPFGRLDRSLVLVLLSRRFRRTCNSSESYSSSLALALAASSISCLAMATTSSKFVGSTASGPGKENRRRRFSLSSSRVRIFNLQMILRCNPMYC
jgi:hypothetical protein